MLQFVSGDLLLSKAHAIAHSIAPNDDFKQGLALSLREQWPSLYKDFRHYSHSHHPKEGSLWTWKGSSGPYIISLLNQEHAPGFGARPGQAQLSYVNHSLRALRVELVNLKVSSLALPKIATGVGGLDWAVIKPLIQEHLGDVPIPIYVYEEFKQGVEAKEEAK
jgi:O-acetyl-ADP-ribose deacetylase (regulator of RNase III)